MDKTIDDVIHDAAVYAASTLQTMGHTWYGGVVPTTEMCEEVYRRMYEELTKSVGNPNYNSYPVSMSSGLLRVDLNFWSESDQKAGLDPTYGFFVEVGQFTEWREE